MRQEKGSGSREQFSCYWSFKVHGQEKRHTRTRACEEAKAVPAAVREGQPAGMHMGAPQQDTRTDFLVK